MEIRTIVRSWLRKPLAWTASASRRVGRWLGVGAAHRKWEESDERIRDLYD